MQLKPGQVWRNKTDKFVVCLLHTIGGKVITFHEGHWVEADNWVVMNFLTGQEQSLYLPSDMMELVTDEYLS